MFMHLVIIGKDDVLLEHASRLLLHNRGVDCMLVSHMRVLRAPLFKGFSAADDRAGKWLFACVDANMVLKGAERLTLAAAVVTHMVTLTRSLALGQRRGKKIV